MELDPAAVTTVTTLTTFFYREREKYKWECYMEKGSQGSHRRFTDQLKAKAETSEPAVTTPREKGSHPGLSNRVRAWPETYRRMVIERAALMFEAQVEGEPFTAEQLDAGEAGVRAMLAAWGW